MRTIIAITSTVGSGAVVPLRFTEDVTTPLRSAVEMTKWTVRDRVRLGEIVRNRDEVLMCVEQKSRSGVRQRPYPATRQDNRSGVRRRPHLHTCQRLRSKLFLRCSSRMHPMTICGIGGMMTDSWWRPPVPSLNKTVIGISGTTGLVVTGVGGHPGPPVATNDWTVAFLG